MISFVLSRIDFGCQFFMNIFFLGWLCCQVGGGCLCTAIELTLACALDLVMHSKEMTTT